MVWLATLLAHLLALALVSEHPLRAILRHVGMVRPMKWSPAWRSTNYLLGVVHDWLLVLPLLVIGLGLGWSPALLGLRLPSRWDLAGLVLAVGILILLAVVLPFLLVVRKPAWRSALSATKVAFIAPRTAKGRSLFAVRSLTAGCCEELLFRGFLLLYLTHLFPRISIVPALLIAALVFGLYHVDYGSVEVVVTGVIGLVYGWLYLLTGSLYLPIILHTLLDLRLLLINWTRLLDQPEQPGEEPFPPSI